jgi:hypothetical protein
MVLNSSIFTLAESGGAPLHSAVQLRCGGETALEAAEKRTKVVISGVS